MEKQKLIVYLSSLSVGGGVVTFAKIFIKQMHKHYDITFVYCIDKGSTTKEIEKFVLEQMGAPEVNGVIKTETKPDESDRLSDKTK